jgi:NAD(P)-dependent dehydrogenase (short-subunit alcohol dehydrogenase family)
MRLLFLLSESSIMQRLENKTALITGAARGIGAAISKAFADQGAPVIVTDIHDAEGQAFAASIGARYEHLDVSQEAEWARIEAAIPHLDVLVNNAGITGFESGEMIHDPENASLATWHAVHAVNLGDESQRRRQHHQHLFTLWPCRHSGRSSLCQLKGRDPKPQQIRRTLLRPKRVEHSLQLNPSRRHPDADLGTDDRGWAGPR